MIHLTETGYNAGRLFCLKPRDSIASDDILVHGVYAPLNKPEYRSACCTDCLKVWALNAYDDDDDMPDWIREIRREHTKC